MLFVFTMSQCSAVYQFISKIHNVNVGNLDRETESTISFI